MFCAIAETAEFRIPAQWICWLCRSIKQSINFTGDANDSFRSLKKEFNWIKTFEIIVFLIFKLFLNFNVQESNYKINMIQCSLKKKKSNNDGNDLKL
jgi:hypothetical protein